MRPVISLLLFFSTLGNAVAAEFSLELQVPGLSQGQKYEFEISVLFLDSDGNVASNPLDCSSLVTVRSFQTEIHCQTREIADSLKSAIIYGSVFPAGKKAERLFFPLVLLDLEEEPDRHSLELPFRPQANLAQAFGASYPFQAATRRVINEDNLLPVLQSIRVFFQHANSVNEEVPDEVWGRLLGFFVDHKQFFRDSSRDQLTSLFDYLYTYSTLTVGSNNSDRMQLFYMDVLISYSEDFGGEDLYDGNESTVLDHSINRVAGLVRNQLPAVFSRATNFVSILQEQGRLKECVEISSLIARNISSIEISQRNNVLELLNLGNQCLSSLAEKAFDDTSIERSEVARFAHSEDNLREFAEAYIGLVETLEEKGVISFGRAGPKVQEVVNFYFAYLNELGEE